MTSNSDGWIEVTLDDLGKWQGGSTPSKANPAYWEGGTVPWVSPKDFANFRLKTPQDRITEAALLENRNSLIPSGSLLLVTRSGILRHTLPVATNSFPVAINQDVKALSLAPGLTPSYFHYQIRALSSEILASTSKSGTTVENLDFNLLRKFPILVGSTEAQQEVVRFLDQVTSRVSVARAAVSLALEKIETLISATLRSAFSGELTRAWRLTNDLADRRERTTVADVAESISYGSSAKSSPRGSVAVLRMGNIQDGRLDWSNLVYTSSAKEIEKFSLRDGDVLFNRTNSPELVGKTATYRSEMPAIAAGYLIVVRCSERIVPQLLTYFLNSPDGRAYAWRVKSDGVSQSNINAQKLAKFEFDLPPINEQIEIVRRLDSILGKLRSASNKLEETRTKLILLEQSVLRDVFRRAPEEIASSACAVTKLIEAARSFRDFKETSSRELKMKKRKRLSTVDLLKADLENWPKEGISFEELQRKIPGGYESIKEALFTLMMGPSPDIYQEFNLKRQIMMLRRVVR
jgi:type I restriction enzyme S subunit